MTNLPDWLARLRAAPEAATGIRWHTDAEIAEARAGLDPDDDSHLKPYGNVPDEFRDEGAGLLERCAKVGEGVEGGRFSAVTRIVRMELNFPAEFWFDPDAPDALLCALNRDCAPHLWFPVGQTPESIAAALKVYFGDLPTDPEESPAEQVARLRHFPTEREVPSEWTTARVLLGVVGEMREIENALVFRSAFCRSFDSLATAAGQNRRVGVTAFNTVQSFSRIKLEYHSWLQYDIGNDETGSPVVAEITYPPAGHAEQIRAYNAALDTDLPLDLPADVVAALFGYPVKGLPRLHRAMNPDADPVDITYIMGFLTAVEGDGAVLLGRFREFSTHPAPRVRARVARYATIRLFEDLVREMLAREQDPDVRAAIEEMLAPPAEEEREEE